METTIRILVASSTIPLLVLGLRSMLRPRGMAKPFAVTPQGTAGLSTIRSVAGGLFLACVSMLGLGLVTGQTLWWLSVAIVMGAVAIGRVVGIVSDGMDRAVIPPLVVELVIGCTLVFGHLVLRTAA